MRRDEVGVRIALTIVGRCGLNGRWDSGDGCGLGWIALGWSERDGRELVLFKRAGADLQGQGAVGPADDAGIGLDVIGVLGVAPPANSCVCGLRGGEGRGGNLAVMVGRGGLEGAERKGLGIDT